jgi:tetratricopeptide (TPR) repeat protein
MGLARSQVGNQSGALTGGLPPRQIYPEAKRAALAAIELHEALPEAHAALGFIKFFYDWDSRGAQHALNRALSQHPHYATAHHGQALVCGFLGRHEESLRWIEAALELEPLSLILNANKGYLLYIDHRYDEAIKQLERTLEIDPSFAATHYRLGLAYAAKGMHRDAIQHLQQAKNFSDDNPQALGALGYIFGRLGNPTAAQGILRQLTDISQTKYVSATTMAEVQAGLGRYDEALTWLAKAVQERAGALVTFRVDPRFDLLRSDPGCQQLLQSLGAL